MCKRYVRWKIRVVDMAWLAKIGSTIHLAEEMTLTGIKLLPHVGGPARVGQSVRSKRFSITAAK